MLNIYFIIGLIISTLSVARTLTLKRVRANMHVFKGPLLIGWVLAIALWPLSACADVYAIYKYHFDPKARADADSTEPFSL